ncbi:hypothetical protein RhiXN_04962 [Rhizoctonia solani]|uniref:RING-type domain-containing protein n=1 Tax=Rhizoctonia solani TaxID=456999 RepID=A0A8H7LGB5_9AGAM|nr:uncharacterized protein RhiXN_04962 [Rhizoctonia solani]KAF8677424.1 hypothetical protein RHS04_05940 [Rhizoctonia solani]KAF8757839.1 hypothetical protein RHS01_03406 [Rhizoctonia solani]QRW16960.1 hypothetical protein RhiXN_04962 [Rhizoctonia solani]
MADYQCPACYEVMGTSPKCAPMALKCGHIICATCLPKTVKRGQANHICSMCRKECTPDAVVRIYLPTPSRTLVSGPSISTSPARNSRRLLSEEQMRRAHEIANAASRAGVDSRGLDLQHIVTSGEQWYLEVDAQSVHPKDTLDTLADALQDLRQKLVYATRVDSLKQRLNQFKLEVDMQKNATMNAEQRLRHSEMDLAQAKREAAQWEKRIKRAETLAAQWEKQANSTEDRRYTESVRAEGAINILRSQVGVLQKELQEQSRRKIAYKKKYYAAKEQNKSTNKCSKCCGPVLDDDLLEIMSSTSTADEAEVSNAFSVPILSDERLSPPIDGSGRISPPNSQGESDDDSQTVIYGPPPTQPLHESKKRKLSDASIASTSSVMSTLPSLTPEEQSAKEFALDSRLSNRYKTACQEGVKEGWVAPDWKAKAILRDRVKEVRRAAKRMRNESGKEVGTSAGNTDQVASLPAKQGARLIRSGRA